MENNKNYLVVGLFIIGMILIGVGLTLWLTSASRGNYNHYFIRFAESVSGLNKESAIKFRGVDVGKVEKISIDSQDPKLIRVDVSIIDAAPIKTDTIATLKLHGITGEVYIELSGSNINATKLATKKNKPGEIKAKPSDISVIVNGLPKLVEKANHVADQLNKIFSDENVQAISNVAKTLGKHYGGK